MNPYSHCVQVFKHLCKYLAFVRVASLFRILKIVKQRLWRVKLRGFLQWQTFVKNAYKIFYKMLAQIITNNGNSCDTSHFLRFFSHFLPFKQFLWNICFLQILNNNDLSEKAAKGICFENYKSKKLKQRSSKY